MRLTKLKLAGFKSFVDPTIVLLPGQLVGVVGPNGCGKSNIIDAVRWVLGESKATALRGESMQDVIFNGSSQRKPVGRASVELVFDNALGKAAGQWSQYAEISVKRVLERNGESSYHINNTRVRRRDVIDVFLGTGLGPRAYAIIEQGTISRIIEAKPEELRLFLEEAAGVTKYKERRRETENRLSDARENLARLQDIVAELDGQIAKLEAQAEIAGRYREFHDQLSERQSLLWLLKRNAARLEAERHGREVDKTTSRLEAETSRLRELEAKVEHARQGHYAASDAVHAAQSEMFAANAEVARLESELQHLRDARERLEARILQLEAEHAQWRQAQTTAHADQARWLALLENAKMRVAQCETTHADLAARLPQAEAELEQAEQASATLGRERSHAEQQLRVEETHRANALRTLEGLRQRRARLMDESSGLQQPDMTSLSRLNATQVGLKNETAAGQEELHRLQAAVPQIEQAHRAALEQEKAVRGKLTEARARRDALLQLQQRVQQNGRLGDWLRERGLAALAPLWRVLHVEPGWETALESVLRERLLAVRVGSPEQACVAFSDPAPGSMALTYPSEPVPSDGFAHTPFGVPLVEKLRCDDREWQDALNEWLSGVLAVDDLYAAMQSRSELRPEHLCVNRLGQTLSRCSVGCYAPDAGTHGVLERQQEIDSLEGTLAELEQEHSAASASVSETELALADQREELGFARRRVQAMQQKLHAVQLEILKLNQAHQRYLERHAQLERDLSELAQAEENEQAHHDRAQAEAARQRELLTDLRTRLDAATDGARHCELSVREARSAEQGAGRELQEARFSQRECAAKLEEIERASEVAVTQLQRIAEETQARREELGSTNEGELADSVQAVLVLRRERETSLAACRDNLETAGEELRSLEEARLKTEQVLGPLRERIGDVRMKQQAAQLSEEQYAARLSELQADEELLAAKLTSDLKEAGLQSEINRLGEEIAGLGAVNLAALEELAGSRERKQFLDTQAADLNQAIATLEDAIRRIDRETREQLRATFEQVNGQFGTLFPQLFGGGEARLLLTGEEILDAGLQVVAQPPGKKTSTIHLLSGGEKALTAIALVFSIFQLNPAPFCLLDEVDAPLDDTNTERFCDMVKRMSGHTQFVFISHNKITMELAQQLIGVTMQESGVSRVVEVDMEEALRLREEVAA